MSAQRIFDVFVDGTPVPQGSKRAWFNQKSKTVVMREQAGERLTSWRAEIVGIVRQLRADIGLFEREEGPMSVGLTFYQARPIGHYGSGRNAHLIKDSAPVYPIKPPDIDKLTRAVLDALTIAGVWVDDSQVVASTQRKRYADRFTGTTGVHISVGRIFEEIS